MPEFKGGYSPGIGTPFTADDELDVKNLKAIVQYMIDAGVDGLFTIGSAGQGPHMSIDERKRAAEAIMEQNNNRVAVILQIGTADTKSTIELAKHAEKLKPAALAVLPLYYGKHSDDAVINHYKQVSAAVPNMPLVMYDNFGTTQFKTTPKFLERMFKELPMFKGCKMSSTDSQDKFMWLKLMPKDFVYLGGYAEFLPIEVPLGAKGTMFPAATMAPEKFREVWKAFERRDWNTAIPKLTEFILFRQGATDIAKGDVTREIYRLRGIPVHKMTRASVGGEASPEVVQNLAKYLTDHGVPIKQPVTA